MFSSASIEQSRARCIAHVDLDAFYTQVEVGRNPALRGRPVGVVQYNPNGDLRTLPPEAPRIFPTTLSSLIAVSYEARARGVKRGMSGSEARRLCPDLVLVQVPVAHSKADLSIYREAGVRVADVLSRLSVCERASIDEVYLDVSEEAARRLAAVPPDQAPPAPPCWRGMHVVGAEAIAPAQLQGAEPEAGQGAGQAGPTADPLSGVAAAAWWGRPAAAWAPHERLLAAGAAVVAELRGAVARELGFSCSAGLAHYKLLAKLGSGLHKPAQQTVVPGSAVEGLLRDLPLAKLRGLGGEYGARVAAALDVTTCGQLAAVPVSRLEALFGDRGVWLHRMAHGIDSEADSVTQRLLPKSLGCGKTFRGPAALNTVGAVRHWLLQLGAELAQRLEADRRDHARRPRTLTVHASVQGEGGELVSVSRSCALPRPEPQAMADALAALVSKWAKDRAGWRIVEMHIGAAGFEAAPTTSITHFMSSSSSTAGGHPPHSPGSREHLGGAGGQQPEARAKAGGGGGGPTQAARPLPGVLAAGVEGGGRPKPRPGVGIQRWARPPLAAPEPLTAPGPPAPHPSSPGPEGSSAWLMPGLGCQVALHRCVSASPPAGRANRGTHCVDLTGEGGAAAGPPLLATAPGPWHAVAAQEGRSPESALLRAAACSPGPGQGQGQDGLARRDGLWGVQLPPGGSGGGQGDPPPAPQQPGSGAGSQAHQSGAGQQPVHCPPSAGHGRSSEGPQLQGAVQAGQEDGLERRLPVECELRSEPTRSRDPVWALGLAPGSRVDPEVLAALPLDIQAEVRQHIAQRRDQPRSRVVPGGKRARTGVEGGAQQGIRAFFTQP
ncbi:hypothetical protein V8C86DRAFT_1320792 [Haematococcus lacustris]